MRAEDPSLASARFSWDDGLMRIAQPAPAALVAARRRVMAAVHKELRRRVGVTFTLIELVRAYEGASAWYLDLAARIRVIQHNKALARHRQHRQERANRP